MLVPLGFFFIGWARIGGEANDSVRPLRQIVIETYRRAHVIAAVRQQSGKRRRAVDAGAAARAVFGVGSPREPREATAVTATQSFGRTRSVPSSGSPQQAAALFERKGLAPDGLKRRSAGTSPPVIDILEETERGRDRALELGIAHPMNVLPRRPARREPDESELIQAEQLVREEINGRPGQVARGAARDGLGPGVAAAELDALRKRGQTIGGSRSNPRCVPSSSVIPPCRCHISTSAMKKAISTERSKSVPSDPTPRPSPGIRPIFSWSSRFMTALQIRASCLRGPSSHDVRPLVTWSVAGSYHG